MNPFSKMFSFHWDTCDVEVHPVRDVEGTRDCFIRGLLEAARFLARRDDERLRRVPLPSEKRSRFEVRVEEALERLFANGP